MPNKPEKKTNEANTLTQFFLGAVKGEVLDRVLLSVENEEITVAGEKSGVGFNNTWTWEQLQEEIKELQENLDVANVSPENLITAFATANTLALHKHLETNELQPDKDSTETPTEERHSGVQRDTGGSPSTGEPGKEEMAGGTGADAHVQDGDEEG